MIFGYDQHINNTHIYTYTYLQVFQSWCSSPLSPPPPAHLSVTIFPSSSFTLRMACSLGVITLLDSQHYSSSMHFLNVFTIRNANAIPLKPDIHCCSVLQTCLLNASQCYRLNGTVHNKALHLRSVNYTDKNAIIRPSRHTLKPMRDTFIALQVLAQKQV